MNKPGSVDVQTFLDAHAFSAFQWTVFAICFFIVLLDGTQPWMIPHWGWRSVLLFGGTVPPVPLVLSVLLLILLPQSVHDSAATAQPIERIRCVLEHTCRIPVVQTPRRRP